MRTKIFCRTLEGICAPLIGSVWIFVAVTVGWPAIALAQTATVQGSKSQPSTAPVAVHAPMMRRVGSNGAPQLGPQNQVTSNNWSGYAVAVGNYTSAQGTWIVPGVSYAPYASSPALETSASWIGIGGFSENTLIQIGTVQAAPQSGNADYYAYYDLLPAGATKLNPSQYPVSPGDVVTGSLQCTSACSPNASQTWTLSMTNETKGWTWTSSSITYASSLASTEWIVEATTVNGSLSPLPYYAPTRFSALTANNASPDLSLSTNGVIMNDPNGGASTPYAPIEGNLFSVNFLAEQCTSNDVRACFTSFNLGEFGGHGITAGSDGALWFTKFTSEPNTIARITTAGTITEFTVPTAHSVPWDIVAGPDGALWFTEINGNQIGRITTTGTTTEFTVPTANSQPQGITVGPDGALWFTENSSNKIGRITITGTITEFTIPTASNYRQGITAGPDGALWFTGGSIGRITTTGAITEFNGSGNSIAAGSDGALWFTQFPNTIGRITTAGTITEYTIPTANSQPQGITAGPDGALWFTETSSTYNHRIGRITTTGAITEFYYGSDHIGDGREITPGPDGALWFTAGGTGGTGSLSMYRLVPPAPPGVLSVSPSSPLNLHGPVGGPFASDMSGQFTLTNTGTLSLNYSIAPLNWMSVSQSLSGSLAGGASTGVIIFPGPLAQWGSPGNYSSSITFTNTTNGSGNTSVVTNLLINQPPGGKLDGNSEGPPPVEGASPLQ